MTLLLETKQKIKSFLGQYDFYLRPLVKLILSFVYFTWINEHMGYMIMLNNMLITLVLSLICSILPSGIMVLIGSVLIVGHSYALGIDVAGFSAVLLLFMLIAFLRFSSGNNVLLALAPMGISINIPALVPIGGGLLGSASAGFPAGCGVILYYYLRLLYDQSSVLLSSDLEILDRIKLLADGMITNRLMWITVIAFILTLLLVDLIRTRSFDYAWQIAIIVGGICYIVAMLGGSFALNETMDVVSLVLYTVLAILISLVVEFFAFGGDYSRTERLQYEDDDYFYFVKAVPKAVVSNSERSIKKINGKPSQAQRNSENVSAYANPIFEDDNAEKKPKRFKKSSLKNHKNTPGESENIPETKTKAKRKEIFNSEESSAPVQNVDVDQVDFEKKLEESLKDL